MMGIARPLPTSPFLLLSLSSFFLDGVNRLDFLLLFLEVVGVDEGVGRSLMDDDDPPVVSMCDVVVMMPMDGWCIVWWWWWWLLLLRVLLVMVGVEGPPLALVVVVVAAWRWWWGKVAEVVVAAEAGGGGGGINTVDGALTRLKASSRKDSVLVMAAFSSVTAAFT